MYHHRIASRSSARDTGKLPPTARCRWRVVGYASSLSLRTAAEARQFVIGTASAAAPAAATKWPIAVEKRVPPQPSIFSTTARPDCGQLHIRAQAIETESIHAIHDYTMFSSLDKTRVLPVVPSTATSPSSPSCHTHIVITLCTAPIYQSAKGHLSRRHYFWPVQCPVYHFCVSEISQPRIQELHMPFSCAQPSPRRPETSRSSKSQGETVEGDGSTTA